MSLTLQQRKELRNKYTRGINNTTPNSSGGILDIGIGAAKGFVEGARGTAQLFQGAGQRVLAGIDPTRNLEETRNNTGFKSLDDRTQEGAGVRDSLFASNDTQKVGKVIGFGAELIAGGVTDDVTRGISKFLSSSGDETVSKVSQSIKSPFVGPQGDLVEGAKDFAGATTRTIKRGVSNIKDELVERGQNAKEVAQLPETASKAVRTGFDLNSIRRIQNSDAPTIKGYNEMVKKAKEAEVFGDPSLGPKFLPGDKFIDQFKLVETQRQEIGRQLGEEVAKLGDNYTIKLKDDVDSLKNSWELNKITKGFTGKQKNAFKEAVKELDADLAPTAKDIRELDRKMSKLERQLGTDGIESLNYSKSDGSTGNVYKDIRQIYTDKLEAINPKIRQLNRQYRPLAETKRQVLKDILKIDPNKISDDVPIEEFYKEAALQLQSLLGNSTRAPQKERLLKLVASKAKELGYDDIDPREAARFARELEDLYDITPKNSLQGRIESGTKKGVGGVRDALGQAVGKVIELGSPTDANKQEALEKMLEDLLSRIASE